jgi:hypothetical protein
LVDLVHLVYLVGLVQPNKQDKPNKPNKRGGLRLKRRLRCGLDSRLLEWHPWTSLRAVREKWDASQMWDESESRVPPILSVSRGVHPD